MHMQAPTNQIAWKSLRTKCVFPKAVQKTCMHAEKDGETMQWINNIYKSTGVHEFFNPVEGKLDADRKSSMSIFNQTWGRAIMIIIAFCLFYLAIAKNFEPLLLIPIGFGGLLANIPIAEIAGPNGFVGILYTMGVETGLFPILIFQTLILK